MGDPVVCCILGICCPPAKQRTAFVRYLADRVGLSDKDAESTADVILADFDLVEKGTLNAFIESVNKHSRGA